MKLDWPWWSPSRRRRSVTPIADRAVLAAVCCAFLVLSLGLTHAAPATAGATDVAVQFVSAANRGDFRSVCLLYSARYVKSQATCVSLYRWGQGCTARSTTRSFAGARWRTGTGGSISPAGSIPPSSSWSVRRRAGASSPADGDADGARAVRRDHRRAGSEPTTLTAKGVREPRRLPRQPAAVSRRNGALVRRSVR